MASTPPTVEMPDVGLLERAVSYAVGSLRLVEAADVDGPTPCRGWSLRDLLDHLDDSLQALQEGVDGRIGGTSPYTADVDLGVDVGRDGDVDVVRRLRDRARQVLGAWMTRPLVEEITIDGCAVSTASVVGAGAVELTAHGWDVAQACGMPLRIPGALATDLLPWAWRLVRPVDRPGRFGPKLLVAPDASDETRLLAFLGRSSDSYDRTARTA